MIPPTVDLVGSSVPPSRLTGPTDSQRRTRVSDAIKATRYIPQGTLALEGELFLTKWFEYRYLSPWQATEEFLRIYSETYRRQFEKYHDKRTADRRAGVTGDSLLKLKPRSRTAIWHARVIADAAGMPYLPFIWRIMEKMGKDRWKRLPRPNQLLHGKAVIQVMNSWYDELKLKPGQYAKNPEYRAENYVGDQSQIAHREWVAYVVGRLHHATPSGVAGACFHHRVLPLDLATEEFGKDRIEAGRRATSEPYVQPEELVYPVPSCFAIKSAITIDGAPCNKCSLLDQCRDAADRADSILFHVSGTIDPVGDHRRRKARDRKRRERERTRKGIVLMPKSKPVPKPEDRVAALLARTMSSAGEEYEYEVEEDENVEDEADE